MNSEPGQIILSRLFNFLNHHLAPICNAFCPLVCAGGGSAPERFLSGMLPVGYIDKNIAGKGESYISVALADQIFTSVADMDISLFEHNTREGFTWEDSIFVPLGKPVFKPCLLQVQL